MNPHVEEQQGLGLVWGAAAIARELNLKNERQAFYILETGLLPARKVGRQWVASRAALRAYFENLLSQEVA
ncbi:DNA-binding protein [Mesorhizobium sp. WSM4303]|uniref:DNA-binding protein n=1 Tax=unclassified Mesorhizobium TaxID=325217 RepID=UPI00115DDD0B|nr:MULTISPECIES: DNA-binding protein [unclassified Mesorhizobium]TRC92190.1 DNA-binding protein [Mesorhizobium sp. WSM4306]TRC95578.1 DNA-binding protein [Mesorhizobium sp. WSM4303]